MHLKCCSCREKQEERVPYMTNQSSVARKGDEGRRRSRQDYLFDFAPQNGCKEANPYG
jgi:hypothetical protein